MCLTVCLGSLGLKFCLLHSNCFLNFLSVSPPLVPRSLKGVPARAWVCQAGLGPTGYSDPAVAILVCLFARCLLFSVAVFPIINVALAEAQSGSHGGRASRDLSQEIQQVLRARLSQQVHRHPEAYLRRWCLGDSPLQSVGLGQRAFVEQACRNHSGPGRDLWAWLAFLFSAMCPLHPLLSRNPGLCQFRGNYL